MYCGFSLYPRVSSSTQSVSEFPLYGVEDFVTFFVIGTIFLPFGAFTVCLFTFCGSLKSLLLPFETLTTTGLCVSPSLGFFGGRAPAGIFFQSLTT